MAKVLISALGMGNYEFVTYNLETPVMTKFFAHAIAVNIQPDVVLVLATDQVLQSDKLIKEFEKAFTDSELKQPDWVKIPLGADVKEAQSIFNEIDRMISKQMNDFPQQEIELYVDITTSLRSIPTLLLSAVRYLEHAKGIKVRKIYYGAFEAKRVEVPVYEMDSFVSLLDWSSAVDLFKRTGSAVQLAQLLTQHERELGLASLQAFTEALRQLSRALDLTLSKTIMASAYQLQEAFEALTPSTESDYPLRGPILSLLSEVVEEFARFAVERPETELERYVDVAHKLIAWYYQRERYMNALQLAREWCITWYMVRHLKDYQGQVWQYETRNRVAQNELRKDPDLRSFWKGLKDLRNRIAHTETTDNVDIDDPEQLNKIIKEIKTYVGRVLKLDSKSHHEST